MILGLTGTFGSGKSAVARIFEELGARVIDADEIAKEITAPGSEALREIAEAFGAGMVQADGSLDRKRLGDKVFADAVARERLNAIVHPRVRRRELELIGRYEKEGAALIVLDVPLLFENGVDKYADRTVVVTVGEEARYERLSRDRGMARQEVQRRLAAQASQSEKIERADHVIDNGGLIEETRRQARRMVEEFRGKDERQEV